MIRLPAFRSESTLRDEEAVYKMRERTMQQKTRALRAEWMYWWSAVWTLLIIGRALWKMQGKRVSSTLRRIRSDPYGATFSGLRLAPPDASRSWRWGNLGKLWSFGAPRWQLPSLRVRGRGTLEEGAGAGTGAGRVRQQNC